MNNEGQSHPKDVQGLPGSEQKQPFTIDNPDRPKFIPDPTLKEASGGMETAQKLLSALDRQKSKRGKQGTLRRVVSRILSPITRR